MSKKHHGSSLDDFLKGEGIFEETEALAVKTVGRQLREGQAEFEAMIEQRLFLAPADFAQAMHWTKQALSKALAANRVFYLEYRGHRYYPKFFTDAQYERRQLEGVCQALGELPGASKWQFLSTPKGSLDGQTRLAALKSGKYSRVKVAAAGFAERQVTHAGEAANLAPPARSDIGAAATRRATGPLKKLDRQG